MKIQDWPFKPELDDRKVSQATLAIQIHTFSLLTVIAKRLNELISERTGESFEQLNQKFWDELNVVQKDLWKDILPELLK